jgi:hypothetical protein
MPVLQTFRNYQIAQDPDGAALEVWRSDSEVSCLVWDSGRQRFAELHVAIAAGDGAIHAADFQALVQKAASLRHPHILPVHEGGEDDGASFYVTDFLDGERLEPWLCRHGALPPWLALQLVSQMASALCAVAPHAELLAGINLLHSGIVQAGDDPGGLAVRVADWGFTSGVARSEGPRAIEGRAIRSCGELLGRMLTGETGVGDRMISLVSRLPGGEELAFLLNTVFGPSMPHHPKTMEQFLTLVERCRQGSSPELSAPPEADGAAWRPRLPLVGHFPAPGDLADALADEYVVDARPFDAAAPYVVRATRRANRQPARIQLLPPGRLCGDDWSEPVSFAAKQQPGAASRHLLKLLSVHPREPGCFVEESTGRWTLERMIRMRGRLEPGEVALVLQQLEEAAREAERLGLPAVLTNPREIGVVFGSVPPADAVLAGTPLPDWPKFLLRVRTWPVTLQFSQPEAWEPESLVRDAGPPRGSRPWDAPAGVRDFALLAAWMMGGMASVPEGCRGLLQDALRSRSDTVAKRSEFTEALAALVGRAPLRTAPLVEPTILPPMAPQAPVGKAGSKAAPGKATKDKRRRKGRATAAEVPQELPASAAGAVAFPEDDDGDDLSPPLPGFAEALFAGAVHPHAAEPPGGTAAAAWQPEPDWDAYAEDDDFVPFEPTAGGASAPSPWGPAGNAPGFATGLPGEDPDEEITPDQQSRARLVAVVVVIAAVTAALAAHFTGTGFWLR